MPGVKNLAFAVFLFIVSCNGNSGNPGRNDSTAEAYPLYVQDLFAAVAQWPDSIGIRFKLAVALDSLGAHRPALAQADSLISKDSTNYGLWFTKGYIAENAGDTLLAMQSYDQALRIYPSADAMLKLANLYAEQKNERVLLICNQVKRLGLGREYDAHADFVMGIYYARTRNKEKALQYFDDCIANDYTYMEAYIEKGLVYFDHNQYREALNTFKFASTVNALDADPYYWQGRCYEMLQIKDSAALRFRQALTLDQGSKEIQDAVKRME